MRDVRDIKAAVVGTGFIGVVHVEALRRLGVQVTGVVGSTPDRAAAKARAAGLPDPYPSLEAHARVAAGELGRVNLVSGGYLQDWLLLDTDWNWRLDPAEGGSLRAVGDIGSHWLDLVEHVTGERVAAVLARLGRLHEARVRPTEGVATFGRTQATGEKVAVATEDYGAALLRFASGCEGVLAVSQVTPGRKNRLTLEIDTSEASAA